MNWLRLQKKLCSRRRWRRSRTSRELLRVIQHRTLHSCKPSGVRTLRLMADATHPRQGAQPRRTRSRKAAALSGSPRVHGRICWMNSLPACKSLLSTLY